MISGIEISLSRKLWIAAGVLLFFGVYYFMADYWLYILSTGVILVTIGGKSAFDHVKRKEESMPLPDEWDERAIAVVTQQLKPRQNLLLFYIDEVISRFVDGESAKTADARLAFLRKQNEVINVHLENYRLRGQIGRAKWEEIAKATEAKASADRAELQAELAKLKLDAEIVEARYRKEKAEKDLEELRKPKVEQPTKSPEETKRENKERTEKSINDYEQQLQETLANPRFSEESRRLRENVIRRKIEQLNEELEKYI